MVTHGIFYALYSLDFSLLSGHKSGGKFGVQNKIKKKGVTGKKEETGHPGRRCAAGAGISLSRSN